MSKIKFHNFYEHSECGTKWDMRWSGTCNDKCPKCGAEIEPYMSFDVENMNVCDCGQHLSDNCSVVRSYTNKDNGPDKTCMGHYDDNGDFEPDERVDLSGGRYDLVDGSDKCYNCGCIVG